MEDCGVKMKLGTVYNKYLHSQYLKDRMAAIRIDKQEREKERKVLLHLNRMVTHYRQFAKENGQKTGRC
jgi:hypothetical protein